MTPFDIDPDDLQTVRAILRQHVPELEVRVFGSRVKRTARRTSDLDLALMTEEPLDTLRMADLRDAFSESDLPFKVDLIDWASTGDRFRQIVERQNQVLQPLLAAE